MKLSEATRVKSPSHTVGAPGVLRRVSRVDRVRNVDIRLRLGQESILDVVRRRQENWKNRLEEIDGDRTTKFLKELELEGKRPRGRPRRRWIANFK